MLHGQNCPTISLTVAQTTDLVATMCNYEHPPLVKALVALTLYVFGPLKDASAPGSLISHIASFLSFRTVQLVMGALSLPLIYTVAYDISKDRRLAVLAAVSLFLEPLYALFSRLDYLDIPMVFFALCAYAVYFGSRRFGRVNEYLLCGIFLGLSLLSKETGIFFVIPLVVYHFLFRQATWTTKLKEALTVIGIEAAVSVAGLQLYDTLAGTPFPTFFSQIAYMIGYSHTLLCPNLCNNPGPNPWYFLLTSNYWMIEVSYNPVLLWSVFVWVPVGAFLILRQVRKKQVDGASRLFVFALLLLVVTFVQNEVFYLSGRIIWVWYFLPAVPALALGEAYLLTRASIPGRIRLILGGLIVVGYFLAYLIGPSYLLYD